MTGLKGVRNLRRLGLGENKLEGLGGMEGLYFLGDLNVENNRVEEVKGIENCLLLKTLVLAGNSITLLPPLTYIFLNKLVLTGNSLTYLPELFLPSLEELYVDHNHLSTCSDNIFTPRLKVVDLNYNRFENFSPIWSLLKNSLCCEVVRYGKGEEGEGGLPGTVREMYEFMVQRRMRGLRVLNEGECDIGTRRYYESQYPNLLKSSLTPTASTLSPSFMSQLTSQISSIITSTKFI